MSSRFIDSFDHYTTAEVPLKWTQGGATIGTASGRHGQGAGLGGLGKTIDYQNTWTIGWAFRDKNDVPFNSIYALRANDVVICKVVLQADRNLYIYAGGGATVLAVVPYELHPNTWYYLEIQIIMSSDPIDITVYFRINGQLLVNNISANTGIAVSSTITNQCKANNHVFTDAGNLGSDIDDLYIFDGIGPKNTDFAGDIAISAIYARSDDSVNFNIFPTSPTTHFDKTNGFPPTYDSDYIYSATVGHLDFIPLDTN
jgi:hypothetical protein